MKLAKNIEVMTRKEVLETIECMSHHTNVLDVFLKSDFVRNECFLTHLAEESYLEEFQTKMIRAWFEFTHEKCSQTSDITELVRFKIALQESFDCFSNQIEIRELSSEQLAKLVNYCQTNNLTYFV